MSPELGENERKKGVRKVFREKVRRSYSGVQRRSTIHDLKRG